MAGGDVAAFRELYALTSATLFGVCRRLLPSRDAAEDVLQEVYVLVWRGGGGLITLTRNRAIDHLRAMRPTPVAHFDLAQEMADPAPSALDDLARGEEEARLHACLDQLGLPERQLITASIFEGSTYAELATRAAIPLGTIKSRIRRALAKLRACLA